MYDALRRFEERVVWACALGLLTIVAGVSLWRVGELSRALESREAQTPEKALIARLEALEVRADQQAKIRCLNVTTGKLDVAIFPVENLGVKK